MQSVNKMAKRTACSKHVSPDNDSSKVISHGSYCGIFRYSDKSPGTVCAASEYVTIKAKHALWKLILSMVSAPLYAAGPIFLGAAVHVLKILQEAQEAFPNAKKVILKVRELSVPLEGERSTSKIVEIVENDGTYLPAILVRLQLSLVRSQQSQVRTQEPPPLQLALLLAFLL